MITKSGSVSQHERNGCLNETTNAMILVMVNGLIIGLSHPVVARPFAA